MSKHQHTHRVLLSFYILKRSYQINYIATGKARYLGLFTSPLHPALSLFFQQHKLQHFYLITIAIARSYLHTSNRELSIQGKHFIFLKPDVYQVTILFYSIPDCRRWDTHTPFKYLAFVTELSSFKTEDLKPDPFFQGQKARAAFPVLTRSFNTYRQLSRNSIPYLNSWARKLHWVSLPFTYPVLCVCVEVFVYIHPWKHPNNLYERVIGNWTSEHSSVLFPTEVYYHTHNTLPKIHARHQQHKP